MNTHSGIARSSAVACSLLLAACGSEAAGGDTDAFCDELRRLDSEESVEMDDDVEAARADLERVRDLAPSEIQSEIDVIVDKFGEFEAFGVAECVLEPSSDGDDDLSFDELDAEPSSDGAPVDDGDQNSGGDAPSEGELVTEPADVPDPLYDPFFDEEPLDTTQLSIGGAQYFLDVNHTDAPWRTKLGSWSIFGSGSPDVSVGGLDITGSEAPEVCSALLDYMRSVGADGTIVVSTYGQDDDGMFGDEEELLRTTVAEGC